MLVRDILDDKGRNVIGIAPDVTLAEAVRLLVENHIGAVVVKTDGRLAGILSERDVVRALAKGAQDVLKQQISGHMSRDIETCAESDSIETLMETMTRRRLRHLPVLENGELCGIVSIGDVVKIRIAESVREAESLREYIGAGTG